MLRNVSTILNFVLLAEDGEIGRCKDFLFDDEKWAIRYMVADTRKWLPGRKVLISPMSLGAVDWSTRLFQVELTRRQVEDSPPLEEDAPVSRQYEMMFNTLFRAHRLTGAERIYGEGIPTRLCCGANMTNWPPILKVPKKITCGRSKK